MANSTTVGYLPDGRAYVDVTEAKILAAKDCGVVQNVIADAITVTLPAGAAGLNFVIRNGGVPKTDGPAGTGDDESCIVKIIPASTETISGLELTANASDTINNTKATAKVGDEIGLISDGTNWIITKVIGIWEQIAV